MQQVDLRARLGAVLDQGGRATCLAFAASAAHEVSLFPDHDLVEACVEYLYWAAKQHDLPQPGTTFDAIRDAFETEGQPHNDAWPYDKFRDDQAADYEPPETAHTFQPRWHPGFVAIDATPDGVRGELDAGRAVVLGIPTWPAFDLPVAGRLLVPTPAELDGGGHAVAVVGYDEAASELLLRNSWGATWGDMGNAWLPFRFLEEHDCEAWTVNEPASVAVVASVGTKTGGARRF